MRSPWSSIFWPYNGYNGVWILRNWIHHFHPFPIYLYRLSTCYGHLLVLFVSTCIVHGARKDGFLKIEDLRSVPIQKEPFLSIFWDDLMVPDFRNHHGPPWTTVDPRHFRRSTDILLQPRWSHSTSDDCAGLKRQKRAPKGWGHVHPNMMNFSI